MSHIINNETETPATQQIPTEAIRSRIWRYSKTAGKCAYHFAAGFGVAMLALIIVTPVPKQ